MNMRKLSLNIDESLKCVSPNTNLFLKLLKPFSSLLKNNFKLKNKIETGLIKLF